MSRPPGPAEPAGSLGQSGRARGWGGALGGPAERFAAHPSVRRGPAPPNQRAEPRGCQAITGRIRRPTAAHGPHLPRAARAPGLWAASRRAGAQRVAKVLRLHCAKSPAAGLRRPPRSALFAPRSACNPCTCAAEMRGVTDGRPYGPLVAAVALTTRAAADFAAPRPGRERGRLGARRRRSPVLHPARCLPARGIGTRSRTRGALPGSQLAARTPLRCTRGHQAPSCPQPAAAHACCRQSDHRQRMPLLPPPSLIACWRPSPPARHPPPRQRAPRQRLWRPRAGSSAAARVGQLCEHQLLLLAHAQQAGLLCSEAVQLGLPLRKQLQQLCALAAALLRVRWGQRSGCTGSGATAGRALRSKSWAPPMVVHA